jgi:AcrR family transcriptional regulator
MSDIVKRRGQASSQAHAEHRVQRMPVQGRSQERIARVLEAAERLLLDVGPEAASIPEIASAAAVPRASIYQYYPDKYALFAHMAEAHMEKLRLHISGTQPRGGPLTWRKLVRTMVRATAAYYNEHPVASILLLKGPFGQRDRDAHLVKDAELARQFRLLIATDNKGPRLPRKPDVAAIAVELAFAVLKYGYAREGTISNAVCDEATRAVVAYLSEWA